MYEIWMNFKSSEGRQKVLVLKLTLESPISFSNDTITTSQGAEAGQAVECFRSSYGATPEWKFDSAWTSPNYLFISHSFSHWVRIRSTTGPSTIISSPYSIRSSLFNNFTLLENGNRSISLCLSSLLSLWIHFVPLITCFHTKLSILLCYDNLCSLWRYICSFLTGDSWFYCGFWFYLWAQRDKQQLQYWHPDTSLGDSLFSGAQQSI